MTINSTESETSNTPLIPSLIKGRVPVIEFTHVIGNVSRKLHVIAQPASEGRIMLAITDEEDNLIGYSRGNLIVESDNTTAFFADASQNFGKHNADQAHVPRAVGAAIAEIVNSGKIDHWHSSPVSRLSQDAKKMYGEYLSSDKRLKVTLPSADTQFRFVVSANPEFRTA